MTETNSGDWKQRYFVVLGIIAIIIAPFLLSDYQTFQLTMVIIFSMVLLGLILLTGFNGQVSLGHGAFFAVGAYTAGILIDTAGMPYWLTIPFAALFGFCIGFLFGLPALRLEGHYLALATFALAMATPQLLKHKHLSEWTGGVQGILLDKPEAPAWLLVNDDQWMYFITLCIAGLLFWLARNLTRGKTGRAIIAIRDQPLAATGMGIHNAFYKTMIFAISAMFSSISGALFALVTQFVAPDSFTIILSITFVVGIVVGGVHALWGAVLGALFIQFVPNIADQVSKAAPGIIFGVVLIGCVYFLPSGAAGLMRKIGLLYNKNKI